MANKPSWMNENIENYYKGLRSSRPNIKFVVYAFDGEHLPDTELKNSPLRKKIADCESYDEAVRHAIDYGDRCYLVNVETLDVSEIWANR